jgi:quercetin 2,3-dioxygenase
MLKLRQSESRGHTRIDWLDSWHTFSFGDYHDPGHMGFSDLRVINDDRVKPGGGFPTHAHRDMEIITYVLEGVLEHKDSMGNGSIISPGDVQRMSAGTGVTHSEYNPSDTEEVHLLQIWILPERRGLEPGYEQRHFSEAEKRGQWRLIASQDGRDESVTVRQDVSVYVTVLESGEKKDYSLEQDRVAWIHVAKGSVRLNDTEVLQEGDSASVVSVPSLTFEAQGDNTEILLFDLQQ